MCAKGGHHVHGSARKHKRIIIMKEMLTAEKQAISLGVPYMVAGSNV